jgi:uncharacterized protein YndB with AHSA1/START domain
MPDLAVKAKPSLTLKRLIAAPPEKVYAAWTEAEMLMRWFGPAGAEMISAEADARVGGRYHIVFRTPDGEEHDVSGTYRVVVPNERLTFTWMWRTLPDRESLVTITLKPDRGATLLTLTHEQFFDEGARDRHREGWSGTLVKLEHYLTH